MASRDAGDNGRVPHHYTADRCNTRDTHIAPPSLLHSSPGSCRGLLLWDSPLTLPEWVLKTCRRNTYQCLHTLKTVIIRLVDCLVCIILTSLFSTCRPYMDRQKPANGTRCPTLKTDSLGSLTCIIT